MPGNPSTPIFNPETKRFITANGKTHRSLLKNGTLNLEGDESVLSYVKELSETEIKQLKRFYKESQLDYTAVLGRGMYTNYLAKRARSRLSLDRTVDADWSRRPCQTTEPCLREFPSSTDLSFSSSALPFDPPSAHPSEVASFVFPSSACRPLPSP